MFSNYFFHSIFFLWRVPFRGLSILSVLKVSTDEALSLPQNLFHRLQVGSKLLDYKKFANLRARLTIIIGFMHSDWLKHFEGTNRSAKKSTKCEIFSFFTFWASRPRRIWPSKSTRLYTNALLPP